MHKCVVLLVSCSDGSRGLGSRVAIEIGYILDALGGIDTSRFVLLVTVVVRVNLLCLGSNLL